MSKDPDLQTFLVKLFVFLVPVLLLLALMAGLAKGVSYVTEMPWLAKEGPRQ